MKSQSKASDLVNNTGLGRCEKTRFGAFRFYGTYVINSGK